MTTPPDKPVCAQLAPNKGWCTFTISDKEFVVDDAHPYEGKTWWDWKPYMVYVPPPTWASIKKFIIDVCKKYPDSCGAKGDSWLKRSEELDGYLNQYKN